jgi:hypothetical protein
MTLIKPLAYSFSILAAGRFQLRDGSPQSARKCAGALRVAQISGHDATAEF